MFRRLTALFLTLLVCLLPLVPAGAEQDQTPLDKLLLLWEDYLTAKDRLLSNDLLLSDSTIAFCDSHTWEDLLRARAAASAVLSSRSELGDKIFSPELSDADYLSLSADGIEAEMIRLDIPEFNTYLGEDLLSLLDWNLTLYVTYFDKDSVEWMRTRAELQKQSALYECQWYAAATNALLLSMNDEAAASAFWQKMEDFCPSIAENRAEYITDNEHLMTSVQDLMAVMENQTADYNKHLGAGRNDLNDMAYALSVGDPYFTTENIVVIEGAPAMLPTPEWFMGDPDDNIFACYTTDAEDNLVEMTVESDLSVLPEYCVVYTSGVEKQTVVEYGDYLAKINLEYAQSGNDADTEPWSRTYFVGNGVVMLRWANGSASVWTIDNPALFIQDWYLLLMLEMKE